MSQEFSNQPRFQTTDGERVNIYPSDVKGKYKNRRNLVHTILLVIFLVLPWLKWQGQQLVLFDIMGRRFHFFGFRFWSHDAPLVFFILAGFAVGLFFITAVWGRVWCGWACPQTVFIEALFRRVERWIEGNHLKRKKLDLQQWNLEKIFKKSLKWFLFVLIALNISHPFLAYFIGADRLLEMSLHSPSENWETFVLMMVMTAAILFDFAWFREQFCIIMCPYGRLQSVLMDENSLLVAYDEKRGEPRHKGREQGSYGACVDCNKCVTACPTGIDIRQGLQLECIACTACIDACDEVMTKVNRPTGLIRYTTEKSLARQKPKFVRARTVIYAGILVLLFVGLFFALQEKNSFNVTVLRDRQQPYSFVPNSDKTLIQNHIRFSINNPESTEVEFLIDPQGDLSELIKIITPLPNYIVPAESSREFHLFLQFSYELTKEFGKYPAIFKVYPKSKNSEVSVQEIQLVGPQ